MGKRTINLDDRLYKYILDVSLRDTAVQKALREETDKLEWGRMQISADQGQFMALLIMLTGARRIVEIGTFTGYSALVMARALPEDGHLVACDISEDWTSMATRYWREAAVAHKIELRLAPAIESLNNLLLEGQGESFDFAFIDADKQNLDHYYELCLQLIRPGGLIAIDNVLWGGDVADPGNTAEDTRAIRNLNRFIHQDNRVDISLVPIGDGLTLARRKD